MSGAAIKVEGLGKKYRIGAHQEHYKTLRETLAQGSSKAFKRIFHRKDAQPRNETIWALKDVSFEVKPGEVVGIIGRNGAGKSTLLKILSRITEPTEGSVEIHGRVGSLLEVGTGFHPELTGRENIYMNGSILGMRKAEIDRKFDEIVDFAEIEKFLDTPVKRYSSGMYVRLAFAVAAHLEPEILLVDEVLAVGDAAFQKKCLGKMDLVAKEGRTVLFVSHNMLAIENICNSGIVFQNGEINFNGEVSKAIDFYSNLILAPNEIQKIYKVDTIKRSGTQEVIIERFYCKDKYGIILSEIKSGDDVVFCFNYYTKNQKNIKRVDIGFSIHDRYDRILTVLYAKYERQEFEEIPSQGIFTCQINKFPFSPGIYKIGARVTVGGCEADWPKDGIGFIEVKMGDFFGSGSMGYGASAQFLLKGTWSVVEIAKEEKKC